MTGDLSEKGIIALSCPDAPGIVHAVSGFLLQQRCNIMESQQYEDPPPAGSSCESASVMWTAENSTSTAYATRFESVVSSFGMDLDLWTQHSASGS